MNIYVAGAMRGIPYFNFPAFYTAADFLRKKGHKVFNPAERDVKKHGKDIFYACTTGQLKDIKGVKFDLRAALGDDTSYICKTADAVAMLPGWRKSKGAKAERLLGKALGHTILYLQKTKKGYRVRKIEH